MKRILASLFIASLIWAVTVPANIDKAKLDDGASQGGAHTPNIVRPGYVLVDSSANGYSMWTQMQECLAYNPVVGGLEFVSRGYSASGQLNVWQTDNLFSFFVSDQGAYDASLGPARYPTSVASDDGTMNGPHISFPTLNIPPSWGYMIAQYEMGGWWTSFWDLAVDLIPGSYDIHKNIGKQLVNGNILFIGLTGTDDIRYETWLPDLSAEVGSGTLAAGMSYWGFDINDGIAYLFYYDAVLNVYYQTTTDGITWSGQQTYNMVWPNPYASNIIGWVQMALTDVGNPILVFDNWDGNDASYPYYSKVYVSTASGANCIEVSSEFAAPDTECFYPTIATGGNYVVVVYSMPRNNLDDSLNWWDVFYNYSTDNGATWQTPKNLTSGNTFNNCMPQLAKRLNAADTLFYYAFGSAITNPGFDLLWDCLIGSFITPPSRWYVGYQEIVGIEEHKTETPKKINLTITPNPIRHSSIISYVLPASGLVSLKLYSADGRLVKTLEKRHKSAGVYTVNLNSRELANGSYFVILESSNKKVTGSLVIVH